MAKLDKLIKRFETKEKFQEFLDYSSICVCGGLLTGFHELSCSIIQKLKIAFIGKQDEHPHVRVPKVTN